MPDRNPTVEGGYLVFASFNVNWCLLATAPEVPFVGFFAFYYEVLQFNFQNFTFGKIWKIKTDKYLALPAALWKLITVKKLAKQSRNGLPIYSMTNYRSFPHILLIENASSYMTLHLLTSEIPSEVENFPHFLQYLDQFVGGIPKLHSPPLMFGNTARRTSLKSI